MTAWRWFALSECFTVIFVTSFSVVNEDDTDDSSVDTIPACDRQTGVQMDMP